MIDAFFELEYFHYGTMDIFKKRNLDKKWPAISILRNVGKYPET